MKVKIRLRFSRSRELLDASSWKNTLFKDWAALNTDALEFQPAAMIQPGRMGR